ncbi:MFS transporter [Streptomyces sp. NPDC051644]|uniref:MFS transporter n=1 Tax=Streptomyces sp. NPDC051644 TaxID=3365666 RepID=UPI0037952BAE
MPSAVISPQATPEIPAADRQWPPIIWAALIGTFAIRAFGFAYPFLPYHADNLGFSTQMTGWIVAGFGAGWLIGQIGGGWLSDRIGPRATLAYAMATATVTLPVLAEVRSSVGLIVAAFLTGVVYDAARPVITTLIDETFPAKAQQALVSGWRHFSVNIGAALTGSLGGYLAATAGLPTLFWVNALACAAFGLAAVLLLPPYTRRTGPEEGRPGYAHALRDTRLWLLSLASLCALICAGSVFTAMPILMSSDNLDATAYGWAQVANAAAVLILSPFLTPWLSRRAAHDKPMTGLLAVSSLLLGVGMGLAGLANSTIGYCLAAAAAVPGEIILFIAAGDLVSRLAPPGAHGRYAGLWGSNLALAVIAAPLLAAWSLSHGGGITATWIICGAGVLGAVLCWPLHSSIFTTTASPTPRPRAQKDQPDGMAGVGQNVARSSSAPLRQ